MEEMSIGEFARRSRLSAKALRLYDGLGLLAAARVDELSGYRYYKSTQLERASLLATLRQIGVPLATVKEIADLEPAEIAERVTAFWREADARRALSSGAGRSTHRRQATRLSAVSGQWGVERAC